jgi:hypothetical protein
MVIIVVHIHGSYKLDNLPTSLIDLEEYNLRNIVQV